LQGAFDSWPNPNSASIGLSFGNRTVDLTVLELKYGLPKVYVLEIIQPIEAAVISRLLIKKFRLTKVQAKVAVLLYNGADLKSIAVQLGVKVNTVKTHKTAVLKKVGVRSQPGLIREVGAAVDRSYVG
jgi:DNA-binding CsgD family transcriptional regulator